MRAQSAKRQRYGNAWWYASATVVLFACLLIGDWVSARGVSASTPLHTPTQNLPYSPAAPVAGDSAQAPHSQQQPLLPLPGSKANHPATGPAPSSSPGKGRPGGLGPAIDLPKLGGSSSVSGAGTGGPETGEPPAAPACSPNWTVLSTPNDEFHDTILYAVTEIASNNVWAGGYYDSDDTPSVSHPVFEHWDGTAWSVVNAPLPSGGVGGQIWGLAANTSGDIWAVGNYSNGTNTFVLIERWGGIQWNVVAGANPSATDNELFGVAVVSTSNVWAVGYHAAGAVYKTLIEQWDGTTWNQVSSPSHGTGSNELQDVSVVPGSSGHDIWAVGYFRPTPGGNNQTLTLHYNGTNWSYTASADQGSESNVLLGVHAIAANDVWATGGYNAGTATRTLAEHWNGTSWSITPTVDPVPHYSVLYRVFATASSDVWAAGYTESGSSIPTLLIEHWNGSAWAVSSNAAVGYASVTFGITGSSSSDLWAVGGYVTSSTTNAQSLAMHYDGTNWSVVRSPDGPSTQNILYSVGADSVNDVWAVGYSQGTVSGTPVSNGVIEHWDGSSWDLVTTPHPGPNTDELFSVDVISPNDVWAVGYYTNGGHEQTLIEHWDGTIWSVVTSPDPGGPSHANSLTAVASASANDVWAVGSYFNGTKTDSLILHWNGVAWVQLPSANPGANENELESVAVVPGSGGNDVWAAGDFKSTSGSHYSTLFEQWNGTSWSHVTSPNVGGVDNQIFSLFALSANDVWAAGYTTGAIGQNLVLHWDGTSWTPSPVQQIGAHTNDLFDVTGTAANDVYVVGGYDNAGGLAQTLVEHWNGSAWSVVPSVTAPGLESVFASMVLISPTNMWAVGLYIPAGFDTSGIQTLAEHYNPCPTSCSITFSDVPPGSTFYPYIHCLACLGIINGYPDGTFKPNANVTRGQLSKIVANSAGFSDAQTTQLFQDVPLSSTFQVFIGRLASRGFISGYACGGPGETCVPPGNLPYFRPNANATRGQISKIDSNAAGYSDSPSGQQFQDVAPGSTYYAYTYRLVSRTIMAGYACGSAPAGPCVPPGNLPYFVPNNNATRGQTSKIVGNTFFPDCSFIGTGKP